MKDLIPNGTPVFVTAPSGSVVGSGVVCDHETRDIGGDEPDVFYHVAMDWPRSVKGFRSVYVRRQKEAA